MENGQKRKVVFLDRDGTVNVTTDGWWRKENWAFTPRAIDALRTFKQAGYALALVTNQGGISNGLYQHEEVIALHTFMQELLAKEGVMFDAIAYCPHHTKDSCECRKPQTGMVTEIEKILGPIEFASSWMIGDKLSDVGFGKALGVKTALIRSVYWDEQSSTATPDFVVFSLYEASLAISQNTLA